MTIRTQLKAGGILATHNESQQVRSNIVWSRAMAVRTQLKAGKLSANHNEVLQVRSALKAGALLSNHSETARVRTIATIRGIAQEPRFSPDGRRVALLVTLDAAKEAGATQAGARQVGEIGETSDEQRLAVFDVAGNVAASAIRLVSPEGRYVYEYDWTPDGSGFVATTALGNGDNNWWVATIDAIDGSVPRRRSLPCDVPGADPGRHRAIVLKP